jgi:hypothetical protein
VGKPFFYLSEHPGLARPHSIIRHVQSAGYLIQGMAVHKRQQQNLLVSNAKGLKRLPNQELPFR